MKGKTCCVTGHRDLPQNEINKVKVALEHEIDAAKKKLSVMQKSVRFSRLQVLETLPVHMF